MNDVSIENCLLLFSKHSTQKEILFNTLIAKSEAEGDDELYDFIMELEYQPSHKIFFMVNEYIEKHWGKDNAKAK